MRNVSDKCCRENQNTYFVFNGFSSSSPSSSSSSSFRKSCCLWDNVEKYCRAGQTTDDNTAHTHCMLDTLGYKHALRMCNTHCFPTTTMVARRASMLRHMYSVCLVKTFLLKHLKMTSFWLKRVVFNKNNEGLYLREMRFFTWLNVQKRKTSIKLYLLSPVCFLVCIQETVFSAYHFGAKNYTHKWQCLVNMMWFWPCIVVNMCK